MIVSVIIPVFNADTYINKAIDSILSQTYSNLELLICDDASSDDTWSVVNNYDDERIRLFRNEKNLGYLKTCNFLFSKCTGDYITFQDADDYSHPERIERQLELFQKNPHLGLCGTFAQYVSERGELRHQKIRATSHDEIVKGLTEQNQFCGASVMIRANILQKVGGYDELFDRIGNEDYDWFCRIVEQYKACNIPEFLYFVRLSKESISRSIKNPKQLISGQIVKMLAKSRYRGDIDKATIKEEIELLLEPYKKDSSLMYRKAADQAAYNKQKSDLVKYAKMAFVNNPLKFINLKYLLHSVLVYLGIRELKSS